MLATRMSSQRTYPSSHRWKTYQPDQRRARKDAPEPVDQPSLLIERALELLVELLGLLASVPLRDRALLPLGDALVVPRLLAVGAQELEVNSERDCLLAQLRHLVLWRERKGTRQHQVCLRHRHQQCGCLTFLRFRRSREPIARRRSLRPCGESSSSSSFASLVDASACARWSSDKEEVGGDAVEADGPASVSVERSLAGLASSGSVGGGPSKNSDRKLGSKPSTVPESSSPTAPSSDDAPSPPPSTASRNSSASGANSSSSSAHDAHSISSRVGDHVALQHHQSRPRTQFKRRETHRHCRSLAQNKTKWGDTTQRNAMRWRGQKHQQQHCRGAPRQLRPGRDPIDFNYRCCISTLVSFKSVHSTDVYGIRRASYFSQSALQLFFGILVCEKGKGDSQHPHPRRSVSGFFT